MMADERPPHSVLDFDPSCCPFCKDSGFGSAMDLGRHVRSACEVTERLEEEWLEDMRYWNQRMYEAHQRNKVADAQTSGPSLEGHE